MAALANGVDNASVDVRCRPPHPIGLRYIATHKSQSYVISCCAVDGNSSSHVPTVDHGRLSIASTRRYSISLTTAMACSLPYTLAKFRIVMPLLW
jgi:hypothetical protein